MVFLFMWFKMGVPKSDCHHRRNLMTRTHRGYGSVILGISVLSILATLCYANEEIFYVYSGGQKVAKIENKIGEEEVISYLVNDSLGSPRVILDET